MTKFKLDRLASFKPKFQLRPSSHFDFAVEWILLLPTLVWLASAIHAYASRLH
jgi:hypothetical protein